MKVVSVDWESSMRDWAAGRARVRHLRELAAERRVLALSLEAGCDGSGPCAGRPCRMAGLYRGLAQRLESQAWLEEHNPGAPAHQGGDA